MAHKVKEMISAKARKTIMVMRGTGHNHAEIAEALGISRATVAYNLKKFKAESLERGIDATLLRIMAEGHFLD